MFGRKPEPGAWVLKSIRRVVAREHAATKIDAATELRTVGVDSLGLMVLFAEFCQEFGIALEGVDPSDVPVNTVGDLMQAATTLAERAR